MTTKRKITLFASFLFIVFYSTKIQGQVPEKIKKYTRDRTERLEWWNEARFGMFIHWGPYAEFAGEWKGERINGPGEWIMYNGKIPVNEYEKVAATFYPVKFDAETWVKTAKKAGMKYIVITAKHCDGFAMFDSDASNYNIVDFTPFNRDPLKELKSACDKHGLKLGFYYSHNWDWHEPNAKGLENTWDFPETGTKEPGKYYESKSIPQIKELMTGYAPDIMWFDVPSDIPVERSYEILKLIREINPNCIINDRISNEHEKKEIIMGDYYTPEQYLPQNLEVDFETCMTLNNTWGYKYYDNDWKDEKTIIQNLVVNASMGGNYLLNMGPDAEGLFPSGSVRVIKSVGSWLHSNGESIYETDKSPLGKVYYGNGACTSKPGKLYLHLFTWPETRELVIDEVRATIEKVYFLGEKEKRTLEFKQNATMDLIVQLPPEKISPDIMAQPVQTLVIEYSGILQDKKLPPIVDPFHTATFTPAEAAFSGNIEYSFNKRWGDNRGYELSKWNKGGSMKWNIRTIREGAYVIELVYGANELSIDNDIHVRINGNDIKHKIKKENGWYNSEYETIERINLEKGVSTSIEVVAGYSNTHLIANFKEVRLIPVR